MGWPDLGDGGGVRRSGNFLLVTFAYERDGEMRESRGNKEWRREMGVRRFCGSLVGERLQNLLNLNR